MTGEVVVARGRYTREGVLTCRAARRVLRPYNKLLGIVVSEAWRTWNDLGAAAPAVRMKLGRAARAMNLSDFIKAEIVRRFSQVKGCAVVMEYGRPVLSLAGGDLKLRLGKIDPGDIPAPRNGRQLSIWSQRDATGSTLVSTPSGTWAKCGYVLDPSETRLAEITVTCDLNGANMWTVGIPVPVSKTSITMPTPLATATVPPAKIASSSQSVDSKRKSASSE